MSLYPDTDPREQYDPLGRDRNDEDPLQPIATRPAVATVPEWGKEAKYGGKPHGRKSVTQKRSTMSSEVASRSRPEWPWRGTDIRLRRSIGAEELSVGSEYWITGIGYRKEGFGCHPVKVLFIEGELVMVACHRASPTQLLPDGTMELLKNSYRWEIRNDEPKHF